MALKPIGKKNSEPKQEQEKDYRNIGTMWESQKFEGHNITINDYHGDLLFQDKKTNKIYKIKSCSLFSPQNEGPAGKVYDLVVNLCSPYHVEQVMDLSEEQ